MNKYVLTLAAAALVAAAPAFANEEHAAPATDATAAEVAADASVATDAATEVELADGSKVVVEGDAVFVVAADGAKTPAPDGEHKAKDGSTITTKDGKLVH